MRVLATGAGVPPLTDSPAAAQLGVWQALLFAIIGGLILNLMPCVLPVLSIKALSLVTHGESRGALRRSGLAYTAGVLCCFAILGVVLIAVRSAGAAAGWGFQLQSPGFVVAMSYILFAMALVLSLGLDPGAGLAGALTGDGPLTVFAPTDDAFAALPAGTLDALLADPTGELASILLYHVVAGEALAASLSDGQTITTLENSDITVTINNDGVFINDAQVTMTDLQADNGVVHVINAVLLPPPATFVEIIVNSPDHETLEAAVIAAELDDDLSGAGPFTVFAPTDEAFAALPEGTVESLLLPENKDQLVAILKHHVVSGRVYADQAAKLDKAPTIGGTELPVAIDDRVLGNHQHALFAAAVQADAGGHARAQAEEESPDALRGVAGGVFEGGQLLDLVGRAQPVGGVDEQVADGDFDRDGLVAVASGDQFVQSAAVVGDRLSAGARLGQDHLGAPFVGHRVVDLDLLGGAVVVADLVEHDARTGGEDDMLCLDGARLRAVTVEGADFSRSEQFSEGLDVLDKIGGVATGRGGPFPTDVPQAPVVIQQARVLDEG